MNKGVLAGTLAPTVVAAKVLALAALLLMWSQSGHAAQASSQFAVNINLYPGGNHSNAGLCRSSTRIGNFGEVVIIECSTGKTIHVADSVSVLPWSAAQDGQYRFVTQLAGADVPLDSDRFSGVGTVTSWRIVNLADWEYLELMVGW